MVAVTGALVGFVAVKLAILPVPPAPNPMLVVLFVQLYTIVPPVVGLLKMTAVVAEPLQIAWLGTAVTVAVGFTVMEKLLAVPVQLIPPLVNVGVTVMIPLRGAVPVLEAVNAGRLLPVPLVPRPIAGSVLVQL